jgi:hypothetical protein
MGGIILSCEELESRHCGAEMRMIRTMGGGAGGAYREFRYGAGDVAKRGGPSEVITWTEFSGDPACRLHASPYRFASRHEADLSIRQSAYHGYESAAEDCMQWGPGL